LNPNAKGMNWLDQYDHRLLEEGDDAPG